ncbi:MAG: homoserine kinase [Bacilli bacterium]|jgi:homoserine kinase
MIKILVPATSANIGPGFDSMGMALELYNEFTFEKSNSWEFIDFDSKYASINNNLVAQVMIKTFEILNVKEYSFKIKIKSDIPDSRGLGSSATCIIAGILAADYYANSKLSKSQILEIAYLFENHPDNITPALVGGLVTATKLEKEIFYKKYEIGDELKYTLIIPNFEISTEASRKALPKEYKTSDVVFNASRIVNLPHILQSGNIDVLKELTLDKIHEPYRLPLIEKAVEIKKLAYENNASCTLSGSGSTLLIISKTLDVIEKLKKNIDSSWKVKTLKIDNIGARVIEI